MLQCVFAGTAAVNVVRAGSGMNKRSFPESYRDVWTEESLLKEAELDFAPKLADMEEAAACRQQKAMC
eukprot:644597-Pelagomonas_calceolata.AAC.10